MARQAMSVPSTRELEDSGATVHAAGDALYKATWTVGRDRIAMAWDCVYGSVHLKWRQGERVLLEVGRRGAIAMAVAARERIVVDFDDMFAGRTTIRVFPTVKIVEELRRR